MTKRGWLVALMGLTCCMRAPAPPGPSGLDLTRQIGRGRYAFVSRQEMATGVHRVRLIFSLVATPGRQEDAEIARYEIADGDAGYDARWTLPPNVLAARVHADSGVVRLESVMDSLRLHVHVPYSADTIPSVPPAEIGAPVGITRHFELRLIEP